MFRQLVLARIIEPTSKQDGLRVLAEAGLEAVSYPTLKRHLKTFTPAAFPDQLTHALALRASLGPSSLVLFDVSTLYFETDQADDLRRPGRSKKRRLDPQITVELLTDDAGRPLLGRGVRGQRGRETHHAAGDQRVSGRLPVKNVIVVAGAGMVSEDNMKLLDAAGLGFILGAWMPEIPYCTASWKKYNPGKEYEHGQFFARPWPASPIGQRKDYWYCYRHSADRAHRTLRGIDEQIAKAEKAVAGEIPVKRNRFVKLSGAAKSLNPAAHREDTRPGWHQGLCHELAIRPGLP
ncbi:IS1634 family transposase [Myceligenerans crystallogenes]|uniref:Transposase DDE domain-containing protein n=1 Tax=Myceligenerans crystallogenes TaxID=316335 RepID=A0ABN2NC88_9MICO